MAGKEGKDRQAGHHDRGVCAASHTNEEHMRTDAMGENKIQPSRRDA